MDKKDEEKKDVIRPLDSKEKIKVDKKMLLSFFLIIVAGIVTGFFAGFTKKMTAKSGGKTSDNKIESAAGIKDTKTFKDTAEGVLKEGGIEGEGSFHLERSGGKSQNVYLTSSTVDLSEYVGMKVKVRGETFKAEKAGWLMDVGFVEVIK